MPILPCAVEGCTSKVRARGWCNAHYLRFSKHGDPLGGKASPQVRRAIDHEDGTRTCSECGVRQPLGNFYTDKRASKGRRANCKSCRKAHELRRYAADPERIKAVVQAYRDNNPDVLRARDTARYERDRVKRIALASEHAHRRRVTVRLVQKDRGITVAALVKKHGSRCHYCGIAMTFEPAVGHAYIPTKATIEHLLPLSRGGSHTWDNVRACCWQCNVRKNNKTAEEWSVSNDVALAPGPGDS